MNSAQRAKERERFDFAVITETAAIKHNALDSLAQRRFRSRLADALGADRVGSELFAIRQSFAQRGRSSQSMASFVVDELNMNVPAGKADAHTRTRSGATDFLAGTPAAQL